MTDKQKIEVIKSCFDDTIWMAIRYAHGRHTYSPSMVRDAVNNFKKVFPDWKLKKDRVIESPDEDAINGSSLRSDYLDDLFSNEPMTKAEFNTKWKDYLEERFYGLAIDHEAVIDYLDSEFEKESKLNPDFSYSQIKLKFGRAVVYATTDKAIQWEDEIDRIMKSS